MVAACFRRNWPKSGKKKKDAARTNGVTHRTPRRCVSASVLSRLNSYIFKHFDGFFFLITHKGPKITHTKYKAGWP